MSVLPLSGHGEDTVLIFACFVLREASPALSLVTIETLILEVKCTTTPLPKHPETLKKEYLAANFLSMKMRRVNFRFLG